MCDFEKGDSVRRVERPNVEVERATPKSFEKRSQPLEVVLDDEALRRLSTVPKTVLRRTQRRHPSAGGSFFSENF